MLAKDPRATRLCSICGVTSSRTVNFTLALDGSGSVVKPCCSRRTAPLCQETTSTGLYWPDCSVCLILSVSVPDFVPPEHSVRRVSHHPFCPKLCERSHAFLSHQNRSVVSLSLSLLPALIYDGRIRQGSDKDFFFDMSFYGIYSQDVARTTPPFTETRWADSYRTVPMQLGTLGGEVKEVDLRFWRKASMKVPQEDDLVKISGPIQLKAINMPRVMYADLNDIEIIAKHGSELANNPPAMDVRVAFYGRCSDVNEDTLEYCIRTGAFDWSTAYGPERLIPT
jgi:hypothetical protein